MQFIKSTGAWVILTIIGSILILPLSILTTNFWLNGGNTFWKKINLPYSVTSIIKLNETEFWVYTENQEIYYGFYPCEDKSGCFKKTDEIDGFSEGTIITRGQCFINEELKGYFIYPLVDNIEICASSFSYHPSGNLKSITFLALTDKTELWIWNKTVGDLGEYLISFFFFIFMFSAMFGISILIIFSFIAFKK